MPPPSPKSRFNNVTRHTRPAETRKGYELMDRNERTVEFPPEMVEEFRKRITSFTLRASPEPEPLIERLAAWLGLSRDRLMLTMGSDAGLRMAHECYAGEGDEALSLSPSFALFPVYAGIAGAKPVQVSFRNDLSLPLEEILKAITSHTRVVALANPNQPVERVFSLKETRELLEACRRVGAMLVMDEAYHHFCDATALPLLEEYDNLIVTRTFSKAFGLAGLRLGFLASQPENIRNLSKLRPMVDIHSVAVEAGLYMLEHEEIMRDYVRQTREGIATLKEGFGKMGIKTFGGQSNSILAALPAGLSAAECAKTLKRKGFLVRAESEPLLANHLRITAGPREQAQRLLAVFEQIALAQAVKPS